MAKNSSHIIKGLALLWRLLAPTPSQSPQRILRDNVPVTPAVTPAAERRRLLHGHFADYGKDLHTGQRYIVSEEDRCKHTLILGPTGAGKSSFMLASTLATDIARKGNSVVIFGADERFTAKITSLCRACGRELYLYPDLGFNPLNLVSTSAQDRAARFNDILGQVKPAPPGADHYLNQQKLFVSLFVPVYEAAYGQPMIPQELWELCVSDERRWQVLDDASPCREEQLCRLVLTGWKSLSADVSGLVNFLSLLSEGENAHFYNQRHAPTLATILDKQEVCVIREGGDPGTSAHARGLLYMVALQEAALRRPEDAHIVVTYLDEFHRYLNPAFAPFVAQARKRRVALTLAFQSLTQLRDNAGRDYRDVITSNARTCVVHTGLGDEDAEYIARAIGKRVFEYTSVTEHSADGPGQRRGQDISHALSYDYAYPPHTVRYLDQDVSLILGVRERGLDAPRLVAKPTPLTIPPSRYQPPRPSAAPPATVWDAREPANLDHALQDVLTKADRRGKARATTQPRQDRQDRHDRQNRHDAPDTQEPSAHEHEHRPAKQTQPPAKQPPARRQGAGRRPQQPRGPTATTGGSGAPNNGGAPPQGPLQQ